jgi:hypothetical protein
MRKGDIVWALLFVGIAAFIALPGSHELFVAATNAAPYLMGFVKFAILATMGEFLAIRILRKRWERPLGLAAKVFVWGLIGVLVVLMFGLFSAGVAGATAKGLLPKAPGFWGALLAAFFTSAFMNLTFGPVFMACHRISDTWIDARVQGERLSLGAALGRVEWPAFISFVVGRTIPLFWIPAHTLTFLLPGEYRILAAAFLSIALGAILAFARAKKA